MRGVCIISIPHSTEPTFRKLAMLAMKSATARLRIVNQAPRRKRFKGSIRIVMISSVLQNAPIMFTVIVLIRGIGPSFCPYTIDYIQQMRKKLIYCVVLVLKAKEQSNPFMSE